MSPGSYRSDQERREKTITKFEEEFPVSGSPSSKTLIRYVDCIRKKQDTTDQRKLNNYARKRDEENINQMISEPFKFWRSVGHNLDLRKPHSL